MPKQYIFLIVAVVFEVIGTASLQASQQFTKFWPSLVVVLGFAGAMYFLTLTLKYMSLGVVYALWSGLGIVLIALIGLVVYKQAIDLWAMIGMVLIIAGIVVIQLLSKTVSH
ncbi:MAG: multidrug efflux SMR transporter [Alphaproteobacteria bacterium]|nr:multidrug efflux SMR transporter [Alphaproteobacteria bacterium]